MKDSTLGIIVIAGLGAAFFWSRKKASDNQTPTSSSGGGLTAGGIAGGWVDQVLGKWGLGSAATRPASQSLLPNLQTSGAGNNSNQAAQIGSAIGSAASGVSSLLQSISGLLSKKSGSSSSGGGGGVYLPNLGTTGGGVSTTTGGLTMPNVISGVDWPSSYDVFGGSGAGSGDIYAGGSDVYGYA